MKKNLRIKLVHFKSPELGVAWEECFKFESSVDVIEGDIFEIESDALVSPGNSFGFMDGGLDLIISKKFGWAIQTELKRRISLSPLKELLVGQAETIQVEKTNKFIICAPTMRVPTSDLIPESVNAYLAMKAILHECLVHDEIKTVSISGLCTGTGRMNPEAAANQMYLAYSEIIKEEVPEFPTFMDARKFHQKLKRGKTDHR